MIKVIITRRADHSIHSFEISGHAESGPHGHDLVCAAVSAVSFGTVNAVYGLCQTKLGIEQGKKGGFLRCVVPDHLDQDTNRKVQLLLEGMLVSLQTIENDYGKYIQINDNY
ncbi:ribosomal-processing cysteine protease Prp [Schinkia azotoformans]|uniref:ribosomal-processing cysteine protease Prp n=1 Tax=Schinkia azotoformans TaxID=1454 RepID=UPI002DBCD9E7|nr:ribosomal-processing cysteine protease Prp [Schinkia azotoformans]MEC1720325.1 ribosomal-processing cysteine protease Prp [Schinkia azotoformans]MED4413328.1 ribosomal-processing cysteine protease Prp [Schinkia azotoformans]